MLDYFQLYTFNSQLYCCYFSIAYAKNNRMKSTCLKWFLDYLLTLAVLNLSAPESDGYNLCNLNYSVCRWWEKCR